MWPPPLGPCVELPMGPRNAVLGMADVATPIGALGGGPSGATKRCIGCGGRMCPPPLGRWVGFRMGPRNVVLGVADA
eukprot:9420770-Pyramimonas_sp.AAC.1